MRSLPCAFVLASVLAAPAAAVPHGALPPRDPVIPLFQRIHDFLHRDEVDGVVMDSRYPINPPEAIRMSVVSQLLGDVELARIEPTPAVLADIHERVAFLVPRMAVISSHTPFDGMLGYAMLGAYEVSGDLDALAAGQQVATELLAIPTSQCILNGGLMVAMAMAEEARLTGDPDALQKAHDIVASLGPFQNADGSFPHWCPGSKDIHYTGWMSMELIHLARLMDDARIEPFLQSMAAFLAARLDSTGVSRYEEPCPGEPLCTEYFYSRATGCAYDYDTRTWTVEPGYTTLALSHVGDPAYDKVVRLLDRLETGGTFRDVWDHIPPPSDPEYPWMIADTSVANTSIIYWALATMASAPEGGRYPAPAHRAPSLPRATSAPAGEAIRLAAEPAGGIRCTLPRPALVRLRLVDVQGRLVRAWPERMLSAGTTRIAWDGRDRAGRPVAPGVYLAIAEGGGMRGSTRVARGAGTP